MVENDSPLSCSSETDLTTAAVVSGYIRIGIKKKESKLTSEQMKYLLTVEKDTTPTHACKLLGVCAKLILAKTTEVIRAINTEWVDIISDIRNPAIPARKAQIGYNMLMRYWLVEDHQVCWDHVVMCAAFTNRQISVLLRKTKDPFRIMDLTRWCVDFIISKMSGFISKAGGWANFVDRENEWLKKTKFDIAFVRHPRRVEPALPSDTKSSSAHAIQSNCSSNSSLETPSEPAVKVKPQRILSKISIDKPKPSIDSFKQQVKDFQQLTITYVEKQDKKVQMLEENLKIVQEQVAQLHRQHLVLQQKLAQNATSTNERPAGDNVQYILTPLQTGNAIQYPLILDNATFQHTQSLLMANQLMRNPVGTQNVSLGTQPINNAGNILAQQISNLQLLASKEGVPQQTGLSNEQ